MIVFGVEEEDQWRIANTLNCKVGKLQMSYLGVLASDSNLGAHVFDGMGGQDEEEATTFERETSVFFWR